MKSIRIKARRTGFRRAGLAHSAEWVTYPLARFTEAQLAALRAEPQLTVEDLGDERSASNSDAGEPAAAGASPADLSGSTAGAAEPAAAVTDAQETGAGEPAGIDTPREPKADAGAEGVTAASAPAKPAAAKPKGRAKGK